MKKKAAKPARKPRFQPGDLVVLSRKFYENTSSAAIKRLMCKIRGVKPGKPPKCTPDAIYKIYETVMPTGPNAGTWWYRMYRCDDPNVVVPDMPTNPPFEPRWEPEHFLDWLSKNHIYSMCERIDARRKILIGMLQAMAASHNKDKP